MVLNNIAVDDLCKIESSEVVHVHNLNGAVESLNLSRWLNTEHPIQNIVGEGLLIPFNHNEVKHLSKEENLVVSQNETIVFEVKNATRTPRNPWTMPLCA